MFTELGIFAVCWVPPTSGILFFLYQRARQENDRKERAKDALEGAAKFQKRVAHEAASVAQKRKSMIESQMLADQNGISNGHA